MTIVLLSIATTIATFLGGLFALRLKDKLHLILGFSAGAVMAVAFFDLIPEALLVGEKYYAQSGVITIIALGFFAYLVLDRCFFFYAGGAHEHGSATSSPQRGRLGALSLCFHSFLDGLAIGVAFHVSPAIGAVVAMAVLTHDFSDGINTVSIIQLNQGNRRDALRWLTFDALAPAVGALSTFFFTIPERGLGFGLALFSGFFLYIGASDLIPESHHAHPRFLTTIMTLLGAAVLYAAVRLAGG